MRLSKDEKRFLKVFEEHEKEARKNRGQELWLNCREAGSKVDLDMALQLASMGYLLQESHYREGYYRFCLAQQGRRALQPWIIRNLTPIIVAFIGALLAFLVGLCLTKGVGWLAEFLKR